MRIWVERLDSGDDVLFVEGDLVSEVIPFLEGDDRDGSGLENGDLWLCHLKHRSLGVVDVSADGVVTQE